METYTTRREEIWANRHYTIADREVIRVVNRNAAAMTQQQEPEARPAEAPAKRTISIREAFRMLRSLEAFGVILGSCITAALMLIHLGNFAAAATLAVIGVAVYVIGGIR